MAAPSSTSNPRKTYIVEHLDPDLGPWSTLEYLSIAQESSSAGASFCLSSVPPSLELPSELEKLKGPKKLEIRSQAVEEIYENDKGRVCLLDPAAKEELTPKDGDEFDVFLFGGILGDDPPRGKAPSLTPRKFRKVMSDKDRTSELRKKGFAGRRLGPVQMTTDTAVRVTRMVVQDGMRLENIPYIDHPEMRIDEHERTEMPFRYVKGDDGMPVMPEGMLELIKKDSEKGFGDLL